MSIPHLDPDDVAGFPVVRLGKEAEHRIADLAEHAAWEQARAEMLERELAEEAGKVSTTERMSTDDGKSSRTRRVPYVRR